MFVLLERCLLRDIMRDKVSLPYFRDAAGVRQPRHRQRGAMHPLSA